MAPYPSHSSSLHDRVKCMVRTRVPTPYGDVFIHLYHNVRDNKEHLAVVIDPAQLRSNDASRPHAQYIRSRSLDAVWSEDETAMDRISRGAYVGRLSEHSYQPSKPFDSKREALQLSSALVPPPLVRIHSECFTGETIGSMRCDCGEQLDNALCRMAQPIIIRDPISGARITIPGRGVIVYMRQEGRGIGLLSKLRAYNLQDLGHDTVQANLMLGYGIDEREYSTAAAILQDLGLDSGQGVRLLTNNPDKIEKLVKSGVRIAELVPMIPSVWLCPQVGAATRQGVANGGADVHSAAVAATVETEMETATVTDADANAGDEKHSATAAAASFNTAARQRSAGAALIGGNAALGSELEKYLRTKVQRMGHMLSLPPHSA